jgi:hypothetical protein
MAFIIPQRDGGGLRSEQIDERALSRLKIALFGSDLGQNAQIRARNALILNGSPSDFWAKCPKSAGSCAFFSSLSETEAGTWIRQEW